jgi:hypothetical protein
VQKKLDSRQGGNRFGTADDAARFFRDNFAETGRWLQVEFGANAEPGTNAIVDIVRSEGVDPKTGVGSQVFVPGGHIGGATFHTHPETNHPSPGFSIDDLRHARGSGNDYEYVFYGSPVSVGRKLDIQATRGIDDATIYHNQDDYAPAFR